MITKNTTRYADPGTYTGIYLGCRVIETRYGEGLLFEFETQDHLLATMLTGATLNTGPQGPSRARQLLSQLAGVNEDLIWQFDENTSTVFTGTEDHPTLIELAGTPLTFTVEARPKGPTVSFITLLAN